MNWQPWIDYEKGVEPLDVAGPPCAHCKFWKPQHMYMYIATVGNVFDGVRMCVAEEMEHDFSCYAERE